MDIKEDLLLWFVKFLIKSRKVVVLIYHQSLMIKQLKKPIIRNVKKGAVYSGFKDNISGTKSADMQLKSNFNKGFRFLLRAIDIFSRYAQVVPLKDKKDVSIVDAFQKILDDSDRRPNKIWVDRGSEFYNTSFKE